uniref:Uncharacterized protein n=1 Tax=Knipowitschia caucasica TaxID=637954 RepID=A0AAV2JX05_KNICA
MRCSESRDWKAVALATVDQGQGLRDSCTCATAVLQQLWSEQCCGRSQTGLYQHDHLRREQAGGKCTQTALPSQGAGCGLEQAAPTWSGS